MDYFARSHDPRHPRPVNVRYRVGQVIQHKIHGYRGIIIGWDPICKVCAYVVLRTYVRMHTCTNVYVLCIYVRTYMHVCVHTVALYRNLQ